jgi:N-hydroxyarylamine O-acetyltransferase
MSEKINLNAYFERVGFSGSIAPTLATLEVIHALHPPAIPFENLDPVMGRPVRLDQASLERKLLHERRGGYCFEHNTLFRNVLRELDFPVKTYAARMLWGQPEGGARIVSHMVLVAEIGGSPYLCDVGSGAFSLLGPLRMRAELEQAIGADTFRLMRDGELWRLEVQLAGVWRPIYQFEPVELAETELLELNGIIEREYFERALLFAARPDKEARRNLSGNRLTIHRPEVEPERREAADVAELKTMLSDTFRIALPPAEELDPALERVFAALSPKAG